MGLGNQGDGIREMGLGRWNQGDGIREIGLGNYGFRDQVIMVLGNLWVQVIMGLGFR